MPVVSGTGMRLKLLELSSMGIPTVTTSLGATGLPCLDGEHVLIGDGTARFAEAVNRLLSDPTLSAKLCANGPEIAEQYAWDGIDEKIRGLVRDTVTTGAPPNADGS